MDYNELYNEYLKLIEENRRLRSENDGFRKQLGLPLPEAYIDLDVSNKFSNNIFSFINE